MILDLYPESDQRQNVTTYRESPLAHANQYQVWSTSIKVFVSHLADRRTRRHRRFITT